MKYFGIYGAGSFSRCIFEMVQQKINNENIYRENVFFIDDDCDDSVFLGYDVLNFDKFRNLYGEKSIVVAIADPQIRYRIMKNLDKENIYSHSLVSNDLVSFKNVKFGRGSIICARFTATCDIEVGIGFHGNIGGIIEHDCKIGNFVTFSPGVICNGNVKIEDNVFVGSGAIIRNGTLNRPLTIGRDAVIGMGAVVTKDVAAGTIVAGNPAKEL